MVLAHRVEAVARHLCPVRQRKQQRREQQRDAENDEAWRYDELSGGKMHDA